MAPSDTRFAVKDVVGLRGGPGNSGCFEKNRLAVTYLGYATRQCRSAHFFRLTPQNGFKPLPYAIYGDPHFLSFDVSSSEPEHTHREFAVWSRDARGWDYFCDAPAKGISRLRIDMLSSVAIVGFPFKFRNVPIPGIQIPMK